MRETLTSTTAFLSQLKEKRHPALVPAAGARSRLHCTSFDGGKDVELILVRARQDANGKSPAVRETLTYREDVAGTDLVYDLTGEFMQGKARPFVCDLNKLPARLYALLPFQIECLSVALLGQEGKAAEQGGGVGFTVEFLDGLSRRAAGALPCHVELREPNGNAVWHRFLATSLEGVLTTAAAVPRNALAGKGSLVVRSQLDGKQVTLPVEIPRRTTN
jgi:hypothetical protein